MTTHLGSQSWEVGSEFTFVVSCAASSLMCLALFVRFVNRRNRIFDSINTNAYGMYLIHYAFVSWLLYGALKISLPAAAKFGMVFLATVLVSWGATALLRRIPALARVI
jgi:surface polysaccharide O-acyltransferase-like enzyme